MRGRPVLLAGISLAAALFSFAVPVTAQTTAGDLCAMLSIAPDERPIAASDGKNCLVDSRVSGISSSYRLFRNDAAWLRTTFEERKRSTLDPSATVSEWSAGPGLKPAASFSTGHTNHVHRNGNEFQLHPAFYLIAFTQAEY